MNNFKREYVKYLYLFVSIIFLLISIFVSLKIISSIYNSVVIVFMIFFQSFLCYKIHKMYGPKNEHSKAFIYLAIGFLFIAIGEIAWNIIYIQGIQNNYIYANANYLIGYILIFIGFYFEYVACKLENKTLNIIYKFILPISFLAIIVYLIVSKSDLANIFNALFFYNDLLILVLIILLAVLLGEYKKGKMYDFWKILLVGIVFNMVYDFSFSAIFEAGILEQGYWRMIDLIWFLSYVFYTYSLLYRIFLIEDVKQDITIKNRLSKLLKIARYEKRST